MLFFLPNKMCLAHGGEGRELDRLFVLLLNGRSPFDNGRRFLHKTYVHGVVVANVVLFDHAMMSCWWPLLCLRKMGQSDCKEIATLVCFFVQLLKGFTSSKEW
jgi:hypothetical protein